MPQSALATQLTTVSGLRTRYLVRGSGPPVLVLHGWGASIEAVNPIVAGLAPVATVHALDLPGFGETELPPSPWGVEDYQRFVAAFMDELGIDRPAIVGHSNGGRIAIRMSATEPERVSRLVLVDAAGIRPKRTLRWYRRVAMAKLGKHAARLLGRPGERLRDALVGRAASADYAAAGPLRPTLVKLVNADLREHMPSIEAPTLIVWGANDADTPLSAAREMERLIPDAGLVILEGAGHYSYIDQSARFARIVSHFLAPPPAGGRPRPGVEGARSEECPSGVEGSSFGLEGARSEEEGSSFGVEEARSEGDGSSSGVEGARSEEEGSSFSVEEARSEECPSGVEGPSSGSEESRSDSGGTPAEECSP